MTTETPGKGSLAKKIIAVMRAVDTVKKDKKHGHFGYGFASADAVVTALREALINNAVAIFPNQVSCEEIVVQKDKGGTTLISKVCVEHKIVDADSGEFEICRTYGYGMDEQDKGASKAGTMAEKEYLKKQFLIVTPDDPDAGRARQDFDQRGGNQSRPPARPPMPPPAPAVSKPPAAAPPAPAKPASSPAAPATQPGTAAPGNESAGLSRDLVRLTLREVTKAKAKPGGTDFFLLKGEDGEEFKTFSESIAKAASEFAKSSTYVAIEVTGYARGPVVTGIRAA